jgi:hypothetical protein
MPFFQGEPFMGKQSSTSKRLVVGCIVAALAIVVVAMIARQGERPDRLARGPTVAGSRDAHGRTGPAPSLALSDQSRSKFELPAEFELPVAMPDQIIEQILKDNKRLGLFMNLHKAVLPDKQTREEYRKVLSDPAMMTAMAEDLMDPGSGHPEAAEYYRRLMTVDYFEAALNWNDNPQRQKVLELMQDIIAKDNFAGDQDTSRRQVLGGSKMELYRLLFEHDAQKVTELVAQAKGTRMEPLIAWMSEEERRLRAREEEILKESVEWASSN